MWQIRERWRCEAPYEANMELQLLHTPCMCLCGPCKESFKFHITNGNWGRDWNKLPEAKKTQARNIPGTRKQQHLGSSTNKRIKIYSALPSSVSADAERGWGWGRKKTTVNWSDLTKIPISTVREAAPYLAVSSGIKLLSEPERAPERGAASQVGCRQTQAPSPLPGEALILQVQYQVICCEIHTVLWGSNLKRKSITDMASRTENAHGGRALGTYLPLQIQHSCFLHFRSPLSQRNSPKQLYNFLTSHPRAIRLSKEVLILSLCHNDLWSHI